MIRATILLAALAGPVAALAPPLPDCQASMMGAAERRALGLSADDWHGYFVSEIAPGWAFYSASGYPDPEELLILEDCAGGRRLLAIAPLGSETDPFPYAVVDAVQSAIVDHASADNPQVYTLAELAALAEAAGAQTRVGRSPYPSCACAFLAGTLP